MFLQSAMLFAEMSYLTDERCFREAQGIMPLAQGLLEWVQASSQLEGSCHSPPHDGFYTAAGGTFICVPPLSLGLWVNLGRR